MKKLCIGILAHVDAGKTTLTESILFRSGMIRTPGRVDKGDAFLDVQPLEKKRGVTIVSKQAVVSLEAKHERNASGEEIRLTFIDTPGHTDFIGETERAMSVMDLAVLLISVTDGITDTTCRLAQMLRTYHVPFLVCVNKMDRKEQTGAGREDRKIQDAVIEALRKDLGLGFLDHQADPEDIAALSETTIEKYLEEGSIGNEDVTALLYSGIYHPVFFCSAIRHEGVDELLTFLTSHLPDIRYKEETSLRVFKIVMEDGHKLSFAKITGGRIRVRDYLPDERLSQDKITQIRMYSGGSFRTLDQADAGDVITILGTENTFPGMGIGGEKDAENTLVKPVLRYRLLLSDDIPVRVFFPKLKELSEEDPLLMISAENEEGQITVSVMGEFQLEILAETILERFGVRVGFDNGSVIYKETILKSVKGCGHFEPLRHYAEVHILMEPLPRGKGIETASSLSVDDLAINWQKTVLSTLEKELPSGVLTGSELTDIRLTLIGGRSHTKHSESRDFAEAARRAVRQGLMKTENQLLEPYYEYTAVLPTEMIGRVMNDIRQMKGSGTIRSQDEKKTTLTGKAPARLLSNYQSELTKFTSGQGRIDLRYAGYELLDGEDSVSVIEEYSYDPDSDTRNPSGSVFCEHGAGVYVPWNECETKMHLSF